MDEDANVRHTFRKNESDPGGLGSEIAGLFSTIGIESDIPELHGHEVKPVVFQE